MQGGWWGQCYNTEKKIKLRENVGWVVGCRVGGGVCGKIYGIIYKGGKMQGGWWGLCYNTEKKNKIKGKYRVGGGVCGKIYGKTCKGVKMQGGWWG